MTGEDCLRCLARGLQHTSQTLPTVSAATEPKQRITDLAKKVLNTLASLMQLLSKLPSVSAAQPTDIHKAAQQAQLYRAFQQAFVQLESAYPTTFDSASASSLQKLSDDTTSPVSKPILFP